MALAPNARADTAQHRGGDSEWLRRRLRRRRVRRRRLRRRRSRGAVWTWHVLRGIGRSNPSANPHCYSSRGAGWVLTAAARAGARRAAAKNGGRSRATSSRAIGERWLAGWSWRHHARAGLSPPVRCGGSLTDGRAARVSRPAAIVMERLSCARCGGGRVRVRGPERRWLGGVL